MFNMKKHTKAAQKPYEKYHRDENVGPKADDDAPIPEKRLPHRDGYEQTLTEDQLKSEQKVGESESPQIVQKELESASSSLVTHRSDAAELSVPPMNALVERIRQKRLADDYKVDKEPHWSHSFNEKKQQGSLPKWPKNAPQHEKLVLNNDPDRFAAGTDPTEKPKIQPLVGNITTADVDRVALGIKTGKAGDFDGAIMAILRLAHDERRELTDVEQATVVDLKKARTQELMQQC